LLFVKSESTFSYFEATRRYIDKHGKPLALYSDKAGVFRVNNKGTVAKLAMRQPFVLFKGLTFQKLCLPGAFRPGDHHNKMLRP
ncbi:hypothetical protein QUH13_28220, partial [Klebsiella pneumoniae]|nr:hypothetical protein [Klebsiella pneumoniae]